MIKKILLTLQAENINDYLCNKNEFYTIKF
jgi:hypothetical protein